MIYCMVGSYHSKPVSAEVAASSEPFFYLTYTLIYFWESTKSWGYGQREREAERRERVKILTCLKKVFFKKEFLPSLFYIPCRPLGAWCVVFCQTSSCGATEHRRQASTGKSESESEEESVKND